jgi:hypothetical protein
MQYELEEQNNGTVPSANYKAEIKHISKPSKGK